MKIALIALALFFVAATALSLLRLDEWWIRIFDFPRAQITVAGLLILATYLIFWDVQRVFESVVLGLLVLALGYQVFMMAPYTVLAPRQVKMAESSSDDANIKLLIANVLMKNREAQGLLDIVREYDPDLILTMETDEWWEKALRPLEEHYPNTLKNPLDNTYGMLVHTRLEMVDPEIRFILEDSIPSMHMQVALASGDRVYLHFVHPDPPNPKYAKETAERDAELLIVGKDIKDRNAPTIVAGDFNDVAWSRTTSLFQKTSGLLDPRIGRGMFNSFNAKNVLMRWPLDHVFHSDHFKFVHMERGPAWGSDHFPIFIELSLEPGAEAEQEEPDTDTRERQEVEKKIEEGEKQSKEDPE